MSELYRPSLEKITLKPNQVLKARVFDPMDAECNPARLLLENPERLRMVLILQETHEDILYNTSYSPLMIVSEVRVVEIILDSLQRRMNRLINPMKWFCSNCSIPIPNPEMDTPCPGCHKILGVDVDLYCQHGLAIDIACDKCERSGFRFEGFDHGGEDE